MPAWRARIKCVSTFDAMFVIDIPRQFDGPIGADVFGMLVIIVRVHRWGIFCVIHTSWMNFTISGRNSGFLRVRAETPSSPQAELRSLQMAWNTSNVVGTESSARLGGSVGVSTDSSTWSGSEGHIIMVMRRAGRRPSGIPCVHVTVGGLMMWAEPGGKDWVP